MPVIKKQDDKPAPRGQKKNEVRFDKALMGPGEYEVTKSSNFKITIYLKPRSEEEKSWWIVTNEDETDESIVKEEVTFRMWTYDEMIEMRKLATKYDTIRRVHMIDHDVLNQLKIQKFMKSWTFDKDNPRLELFHTGGVLVDEVWAKVKMLQPNILKHIIEEMNVRYEFGG